MRSPLAFAAAAGLVVVALTGCTAPAPEPRALPGSSSTAIEVRGDFGEPPRVDFPTPLQPDETQCSVVIAGEGPTLDAGQLAVVAFTTFNGRTGEQVEAGGYGDEDPQQIALNDQVPPGLVDGLTCANEGSRVAIVLSAEDAGGENSVVFVIDVARTFPTRADGAPQLSRDGFPAVVLAPDGRPGITVPDSEPPVDETSEVEVLRAGSGEVVESGDQVVLQYTGVLWDEGTVFDSSWDRGAPAVFEIAEGEASQSIEGFSTAVLGQKVGSQVAVVVPPGEGYGPEGNPTAGIPGDATLFFVIDILGVL